MFDTIPREIKLEIFKNLSKQDLEKIKLVSKENDFLAKDELQRIKKFIEKIETIPTSKILEEWKQQVPGTKDLALNEIAQRILRTSPPGTNKNKEETDLLNKLFWKEPFLSKVLNSL